MSKICVIVESPNKCKKIEGYLKNLNDGNTYQVLASFGHIMDLLISKSNKFGVELENNFKPIYEITLDKKDKVEAIKCAAKNSDSILLATDMDREGECIAFHVFDIVSKFNKPIKRAIFKEITAKGIKDGIKNIGELDENFYKSQQARRVLDRIVGFSCSPLVSETFNLKGLSAGRCQSIVVKLIADREKEIEAFKPEEYFSISAQLAKPDNKKENFVARLVERVVKKERAEQIKNELLKDDYVIQDIISEEKLKYPSPPLITSTLQMICSKSLKFSPTKTMTAAQKLFENGLITYHRTDSVSISSGALSDVREYIKSQKLEVPDKPNEYKSGGNAQESHEAIRPTNINTKSFSLLLPEDEKKVYQCIWEYFVASQMKPSIYHTVIVNVKSSSGHILKANGRVLKYKGWEQILTTNEDKKDVKLPDLNKNDKLILVDKKVKCELKSTQGPQRFKQFSLLDTLEKKGIGRPSTYANLVAKVSDRHYVELKKEMYYITELGRKVVSTLEQYFKFMDVAFSSSLETKLDLIAENKLKYVDMLENFYGDFQEQLLKAKTDLRKNWGFSCKEHNKPLLMKDGPFGLFLCCSEENCKNPKMSCYIDEKGMAQLSDATDLVPDVKCKKCGKGVVKRTSKFGEFYACSDPSCKTTMPIPCGVKCKLCGGDMRISKFDGISKRMCMEYPKCFNSEII